MPADSPDLRQFLSGIAVFGGLRDESYALLISMLKEHQFERGDIVCREGDTGRCMYVVRTGEVIVCRNGKSGHLIHMVRLGPGEIFGEMTLIDVQPRSATIQVDGATTLYSLTNKDLYELYQKNTEGYVMVLQNICRELSRRLRRADSRITQLADKAGDESTQISVAPRERR